MANLQNEQERLLGAATGAPDLMLTSEENDPADPEITINLTIDERGPLPGYWPCLIIDLHRDCCWNFLTKEEQRDVFAAMKAQKEQDGAAFARAILKPKALKMTALINTVSEECYDHTAKFLYYMKTLDAENKGRTFDHPFQHNLNYILYVVPGVKVHNISGNTFQETRVAADETGFVGQFGQLPHQHSTPQQAKSSSVPPLALDTIEQDTVAREDLETEEGEATASKKKRKRRNRRRKAKMSVVGGVPGEEGANGSNVPAVVTRDQAPDDMEQEEDVAINNNSNSNNEIPAEDNNNNNTNISTISSCGATLNDSIPRPRSIPCRQRYNEWSSAAIDQHVDFFTFPIDSNFAHTFIDGPEDRKDKRTLFNHVADEILEKHLVIMNAEHPFESSMAAPGPALGVMGYGNPDYGMYPELDAWLK